jgi:hypothetical protein
MKHLDLFCGKQYGWAKGFKGFKSTGIDIVDVKDYPGKFIKADLLDYEPIGKYDVITASPPCTEFSIAKKYAWGTQDERIGLDLVHRTLYLISRLKPRFWIMENVYGLADFIGPPRQKIRYSLHPSSKWAYFWGEFPEIGMLPTTIEYKKNDKVRDPWKRAEIPLSISSTFARMISSPTKRR